MKRPTPHASPSNRGKRFPAEVLTEPEVSALLRACSSRAVTGIRNRALLTMLYRGGLRISEALDLAPKDLDRKAATVRVLHGKGDRSRTVGLDDGAFATIERWIDQRSALGINGRAPLFCTLKGEPIKTPYVRALLPRLAKRAGILKRVHAHGLRHTHAAELAGEGTPINVIQAQLGHSNAATTSRYLNHVAPRQLIDTMKQRKWDAPAD